MNIDETKTDPATSNRYTAFYSSNYIEYSYWSNVDHCFQMNIDNETITMIQLIFLE